jgi:hypothetical protein
MTDTPMPDPLPNDVVDELLSALADDEFDAAASDLGMTPDEARARLAATTGVDDRRRALGAARAEVADVPPLDALTRRRLVDRSLRADHHDDRNDRNRVGQWLLGAAGVAAAVAIVFALLALPGRDEGGDASTAGKAVSATTSRERNAAQSGAVVIDDERALQSFVSHARAADEFAARAAAPNAATTGSSNSMPPAAANDSAKQSTGSATRAQPLADVARCNATIATEFGLAGAPIAQTTPVTHDGTPAVVVIFARDRDVLGFLYDPGTCKVLISTFSK